MSEVCKLMETDRTITIWDRVSSFRSTFPRSHLCVANGHIESMWIMGNSHSSGYSKEWYDAYPKSFPKRVMAMFPELKPFHLFNGWVKAKWCAVHQDNACHHPLLF